METPKKKKITTSKLILAAMISLIFIICFFSMYEMHRLNDLSPLYALIGIVAALAPVIWAYFSKAAKENCSGGILYDTVMAEEYGKIMNDTMSDEHDYVATDDDMIDTDEEDVDGVD